MGSPNVINNVNTVPVVVNTVPALQWMWTNPGALAVCQGDCDNDASCPGNSVCVKRTNGLPAVPGCSIATVSHRDGRTPITAAIQDSPAPTWQVMLDAMQDEQLLLCV